MDEDILEQQNAFFNFSEALFAGGIPRKIYDQKIYGFFFSTYTAPSFISPEVWVPYIYGSTTMPKFKNPKLKNDILDTAKILSDITINRKSGRVLCSENLEDQIWFCAGLYEGIMIFHSSKKLFASKEFKKIMKPILVMKELDAGEHLFGFNKPKTKYTIDHVFTSLESLSDIYNERYKDFFVDDYEEAPKRNLTPIKFKR